MPPLVSIIIPVYNAEKWLAQAIESALNQTWASLEVLLVDDGSTDQSLAIAHSYQQAHVQVISQENQGASAARNRGLALAQGDYIQYLDADDMLAPTKIADQVTLLSHSPEDCLAVGSTIHFLDGDLPGRGILQDGLPFSADNDHPTDWLIHLLGGGGKSAMIHPAAWLVPRAVSDRAGLWNTTLTTDDDGEYFARVILSSAGIRRSPSALTYYRKFRTRNSLSHSQSFKAMESSLKALALKHQHILQRTQSQQAYKALAHQYKKIAVAAYPQYPSIAQEALRQVNRLGGTDFMPPIGGWRLQLLGRMFGWKFARWSSHQFSRLQKRFPAPRIRQVLSYF